MTGSRFSSAALAATALAVAAFIQSAPALASGAPIALAVDAREAPRNILHVRETIPVARAGPLTLAYPKWIPGEHGPTGPIASLASLRIQGPSGPIAWQRDAVDLYAFHLDVPSAVTSIDVSFDELAVSDDPMTSPNLAIINWNRVLLYPLGPKSDDIAIDPSIALPAGWEFGTALSGPRRDGDMVRFATTDLTTLVDSPLDAGRYFRRFELLDSGGFTNEIDAFADSPGDLALPDADVKHYKDLVAEADALYGARHWRHYHFLLTLSDAIGFQGIEHHQSSDNRADESYFTDPAEFEDGADLLPHEFSHSWNGKYRRPAGLVTADYQQPEKTELLWVYEGLNQYLGDLLVYRCGLIDPKEYPEYLAHVYALMDREPGRLADPLADTAIAAPYLYQAPGEWQSTRRTANDFYYEGELLWLSVDAIIRTQSHGARSLDDFLKAFDGQRTTPPMVVPYTRGQVEAALAAVQPYDWHGFFQKWVYDVAPHAPAFGIDLTGWRLAWNATPNHFSELDARVRHRADFESSLGFSARQNGAVTDVLSNSPAAAAGLGPAMQIVAVDGVKFDPERLLATVRAASPSSAPIVLLVDDDDRYHSISIDYHGGVRYPHLERVPGTTDLLAKIMAAHRPH